MEVPVTSSAEQTSSVGPNESVEAAARSRITLRAGQAADSVEIAALAHAAGGETSDFILKGMHHAADAAQVYRTMVADSEGMFSFRNCVVAVASGCVVGIANAFPATIIKNEAAVEQMTERDEFLRPRTELNDWSSYFLNNISVKEGFRRRGAGSMLLAAVFTEARARGFPSVTLHVWADNLGAIAFYRKSGFRKCGRATIPWHVDFPHEGESLLLRLPLRIRAKRSGAESELAHAVQSPLIFHRLCDRCRCTLIRSSAQSIFVRACGTSASAQGLRGCVFKPRRSYDEKTSETVGRFARAFMRRAMAVRMFYPQEKARPQTS